jgi:putative hemolysin
LCYNGADLNTDPSRSSPEAYALQFAALVALVILAAFFAASEAALISISKLRARSIAERKVRGSKNLVAIVEDKNRFLTSVLIGNTIVLLASDSLATWVAFQLGLPYAAVVSTVVMTIVMLTFGEIIPKMVATADAERWALRLAWPMRYVTAALTPIGRTFQFVTELMLRPFGIRHGQQIFVTEEDIRTLVNVGAEQRVIEEEERELIHSVMEFGDTIVREVMKPRPLVVAVSIDDSARRVLDVVIAEGYSKLPVFQETKDDIVGVVHDRELLIALANGSLAHETIRKLMRTAVHVPETKKIAELLREMQRDKFSMAIVVDEYGGTAGIVTMEDLLEEIVGEIRDEHDVDEQEPIHIVSETEAIVDAGTNIEDVNAKLHTKLPTDDFETIGGYTVGLFGRLPVEGEEIEADKHTRLRVDRTRGRRILAVRIYTNGVPEDSEELEPTDDAAARL